MMPRNVLLVAVVALALLSASVSASLLEATAEPSKDAAAAKKKKDIDYMGSVGAARGAKPQPRKLACDITSKGPLCLFGGQTVLSAPAHVSGLVAHYTFDDSYGLDSGAHQLHGETVMPSGPGIFGHGRSALVQNGDGFAVRSSSKFARVAEGGRGAALSFWVYLHGDAETHSDWCTVVAVGQEEGARAALSVDVDPFSGQLRVSATNAKNEIDRFRSVAQLAFDRWHHVVVSRDERTNAVTLYTDGVEDTAAAFGPAGALKEYRLWAGHAPWDGQYCTSTMLIDELRVLSRSMRPFEVQAESFPSLGSVEPDFMRLGCQGCNYAEATERCSKLQRSVCRERELVSGALQVAFALGYGNRKDAFHAYELRSVDSEKKIALCCSSS